MWAVFVTDELESLNEFLICFPKPVSWEDWNSINAYEIPRKDVPLGKSDFVTSLAQSRHSCLIEWKSNIILSSCPIAERRCVSFCW